VKFAEIEQSLGELRSGRMIVIADDEDRENEGDLMIAAEMVTPEVINFMATSARGLICLAMTGERLDQLELGPMVAHNTANLGTAFTVSIDARGRGVTTGISSYDRAQTILAAVDPELALKTSRVLVMCFPCAPGPMAFLKDAAKQKRRLTSHDWQGCITPQ
jgi:3,4-dihydroxy 2-butanone 4-phosphate synthase/GTP cyclohydrolase II